MRTPLSLPVVILASLFSGCGLFSSPYSAQTSDDIRQLVCRTNEVVADGEAGKLSSADGRQFVKQSQAQVQIMRLRYVGKEAKPHMDNLDREYATLLRKHRPLRRRTTSELRATLFALQSLGPVYPITVSSFNTDDIGDSSGADTTSSSSHCNGGSGGHCGHGGGGGGGGGGGHK
jgi:uncharacterized membrane protein YgcG